MCTKCDGQILFQYFTLEKILYVTFCCCESIEELSTFHLPDNVYILHKTVTLATKIVSILYHKFQSCMDM